MDMLDQFPIAARIGFFPTHHFTGAERVYERCELAGFERNHVVYHPERCSHFRARALAHEGIGP